MIRQLPGRIAGGELRGNARRCGRSSYARAALRVEEIHVPRLGAEVDRRAYGREVRVPDARDDRVVRVRDVQQYVRAQLLDVLDAAREERIGGGARHEML